MTLSTAAGRGCGGGYGEGGGFAPPADEFIDVHVHEFEHLRDGMRHERMIQT